MALNIIFMGTPDFAVPILQSLNQSNHKILEVYTQPPKKKDRGQKINPSPINLFCNDEKINIRCPNSLDTDEELKHIKDLNPDVVIVVAYGKILPSKLLDLKKIIFINIHASLLPKWRGAAPIHRAIMNLDEETGISIMKIYPKLDAGPVMLSSKIKINKETNFNNLSRQLSLLGSKMILESLKLLENNKAEFLPQTEAHATYANKITKDEAKIDWMDTAEKIIAKINALHLNPGSWFELKGQRIKILKALEIIAKGNPGDILDNNFTVGCKENAVQILELKKEGKKKMSAKEFLKGNHLKIGSNINTDV